MKHRRFILISASLLVLAGLIFFLTNFNEPTYEGRSLTAWLRQLDKQAPRLQIEDSGDSQLPDTAHAIHAIRAIGTNGIPTLLNLLNASDNVGRQRVEKIINRIGFPNFHFPPAYEKHRLAQWGFLILGRQGQSAVPNLMQIVRTNPNQQSAFEALYCLDRLKLEDRAMMLCLIDTLGSTNHALSSYAATRLNFRYPATAHKADLYKEYSLPKPEPNTPPTNKSPASIKNIFPHLTNPGQPDSRIRAETGKP